MCARALPVNHISVEVLRARGSGYHVNGGICWKIRVLAVMGGIMKLYYISCLVGPFGLAAGPLTNLGTNLIQIQS